MSMKKLTVAILVGFLTAFFPMGATAEVINEGSNYPETQIIMPRLTYIVDAETDLGIKSGVATVDCWVKGSVASATKTKVIAELQLKSGNNWIAYGTWTNTENAFKASVYETKAVTAGHTYRVKATYTVWEGSESETIVVFGDEVTA